MTSIPPITDPLPTPEPRKLLDAVLALVALLPEVDRETVAISSDALRLATDARAQLTAEKAAREEAERKLQAVARSADEVARTLRKVEDERETEASCVASLRAELKEYGGGCRYFSDVRRCHEIAGIESDESAAEIVARQDAAIKRLVEERDTLAKRLTVDGEEYAKLARRAQKRSFSQLESDVRAPETSVLAVPHDEPTDRDRAIVEAAERWRECDLDCSNVRGRLDALADAIDLPKTPDVLAPAPHGDLPPELEHPANKMAREAARREGAPAVRKKTDESLSLQAFRACAEDWRMWASEVLDIENLDADWPGHVEAMGRIGTKLIDIEEKLRLATEQVEACRELLESADRAFKVGPVKPLNWEERLDASRKERGKTDAK